MDTLASEPRNQLFRVLVRVNDDPRRRLAGAVQARCFRSSHIEPHEQLSSEIANRNGRFIRLEQTVREGDSLGKLEAVREYSRQEIGFAFRRMACNTQLERPVNTAIRVGEIYIEGVNSC